MIVCAKNYITKIRTLITSIEFELTPETGRSTSYVPDRQDIMLKLFYIREASYEIEKEMLKDWPLN